MVSLLSRRLQRALTKCAPQGMRWTTLRKIGVPSTALDRDSRAGGTAAFYVRIGRYLGTCEGLGGLVMGARGNGLSLFRSTMVPAPRRKPPICHSFALHSSPRSSLLNG